VSGETRERFAALAAERDEGIDLARGALLIAAESEPELDVAAGLARLDELAELARPALEAERADSRAARLVAFLCQEQGFVGNERDYDDPANSSLGQVLERRMGIPITLSVLWLEVARRLGISAHGIGFPGHFLVGAEPELIVDPFHGRLASREDCRTLLQRVMGPEAELAPEHLRPVGTRQILARILINLKQLYSQREDWRAALACSDRLLLLFPDAPLELRDRGLIHGRLECYRAAVSDLERFTELSGGAALGGAVAESLAAMRELVRRLH
jgi:regulator of sirC expression with transglutaminase-like and TPR domain